MSEFVNANDDTVAFFDFHLPFVSRVLDFFLDVAFSDCFRSATDFVNFLNVFPSFSFDLVGQSFYIVGTAQRINGVSQTGFVSNDLLGTQSDGYRLSGRQCQSFVFGVGVQGLSTTHYSSSSLQSNTNDVVVRLLSSQHGASGLGMYAEHHGFSFFSAKTLFHNFGPYTTGSTEFSNLFQYVVVCIPEEGQTASESVNVQTSFDSSFYISDAVSDGECNFLRSGGTSFTDMVTGDGNGVPQRYVLGAIFKNVGDQTHGRFRWENVSAASSILFQNIVLNGTTQFVSGNALFFSYCNVHSQQYGSRSVDGHGSGYFIQGNLVEQDFHVSQGVDSYAYFTNFAFSHRIGGIITDLGRQVECAGQAGTTVSQQVTITFVGFFSGGETSIHTHGPETATIHGRLNTTGVRIFTGEAQFSHVVKVFTKIYRGVQSVRNQVCAFRVFYQFSFNFSMIFF